MHTSPTVDSSRRENAEFVALAIMVQDWNSIATWMREGLFSDDLYRRAYLAVASVIGNIAGALEAADPDAREVIERAAVADIDSDPFTEAKNLISAAVRRELSVRNRITDPDEIRADRDTRILLEEIDNPTMADAVAMELLDWLGKRVGEHA